jgi:hypothetical protein
LTRRRDIKSKALRIGLNPEQVEPLASCPFNFPPHALYIFCPVIFIFTSLSKLSVKNHQNKLCGSILKTVKKQPFLT